MTKETILKVVRALGVCSIVAGGFGLVGCTPYLLLNNWFIVGVAGVVSTAAAIVYVGGLLVVAYLLEK